MTFKRPIVAEWGALTDRELLSRAVTATGLTLRGFARRNFGGHYRTVLRWRSGRLAMSPPARRVCTEILEHYAARSSDAPAGSARYASNTSRASSHE